MNLVFRCDATASTGLGHLSRSLALAEAVRRAGGHGLFVGHWSAAACAMLDAAGFSRQPAAAVTGGDEDADLLAGLMEAGEVDGVVADSYDLGVDWILRLARRDVRVVLIDDFAKLPDYSGCAGVINFTVEAGALDYRGLERGRLALGPEYFFVREKLMALRRKSAGSPPRAVRRVLVSLGGGDRLGMTVPVYRALRRLQPDLQVRAIVPRGTELARGSGLDPADFPAQAPDLSEHYAWADCCVSGGGLTKYECGYLGLPVAIFSQTEREQVETNAFCATGIGCDLAGPDDAAGWERRLGAFLRDESKSAAALKAARRIFPGDSSDRAAAALARFLVPVPMPILS